MKKLTRLGWLAEKAFDYRGPCENRAFEVGVYLDAFDKALQTARTILEDMRSGDGDYQPACLKRTRMLFVTP